MVPESRIEPVYPLKIAVQMFLPGGYWTVNTPPPWRSAMLMAVNVMRWIGQRIAMIDAIREAA